MGWLSDTWEKTKDSVEKTIESPERLVTKPFEQLAVEPIKKGIKTGSEFINSPEVQSTVQEAGEFIQSPGGQQAFKGGLSYLTGNPAPLLSSLQNQQQEVVGRKTRSKDPQPVSNRQAPPIQTTRTMPLWGWIGIGVGALAIIYFAFRRK